MKTEIQFTHIGSLADIRKITKVTGDSSYMMKFNFINEEELSDTTFYLPASIFENAIEKYLLTKSFKREDIMGLRFQVVITNSFYWKYQPVSKLYSKIPGIYGVNYLNFISVSAKIAGRKSLDLDHISGEIENQEEISL
jgi:hypothetical protein